ncbi:adenylosuccinate synthase [Pandoraea cepalis]|nr:adenylosuccinate synthase [Pandoraea cepalis]
MSECQAADNGETPDAIGFRNVGYAQHTVLVEAKTTRSDFLADARKPHRMDPAKGMGDFRYFIAPVGLIDVAELPPKWGLVEVKGKSLKVRAGHVLEPRKVELNWAKDYEPWRHDANKAREMSLIVKMLARVGDVDAYQRELKSARNEHARAARDYEREYERAENAWRVNVILRNRLEQAGISTSLEDASGVVRARARIRKAICDSVTSGS